MKKSVFQKLLSVLLCLCMILSYIPASVLRTSAAADAGVIGRVADPVTMNRWQELFNKESLTTEFAGGVWTDKSVMTDADQFMAQITMNDPDNNFLVALSAMAANQRIDGYTSAPVDVMLVLDVSGSMAGNKATTMIQAANRAIDSLLQQNNNNRVGVVLYSGKSTTGSSAADTATVILPLGRYTSGKTDQIRVGGSFLNPEYETFQVYLNISGNKVSIESTVLNGNKEAVKGSKNVSGGTYIQNGLYKAWGEFSAVTDVKVSSGPQKGAQRTPVMVLMSDGRPTTATADYNNVGDSNTTYGNGDEDNTTWQTVFLTQLTAAWTKAMMTNKYGTTAKFYTLGLGTGTDNYATQVLNPNDNQSTLNSYWRNFLNNTPNAQGNVAVSSSGISTWRLYKDSNIKSKDYVDLYKLAANTDELLEAFQSITDSIELDAAEHVTLVEEIGEDFSGYITVTDELGAFMDVKDIKGLVLGDTLFTGHELAESLQESSMGDMQNPTDYGNEFIRTVRERLGIESVATAQNLVIAAYADGQLAYDPQTEEYSNYIGWYSNDAGDYLGFWDKDSGISSDGAPAGATWINKSYGYLGTAGDSDMMHVVVMLSTHVDSGMQVMQYKIPASLIPTLTYKVELNSSDPTDMKSISVVDEDVFPLRLVYEVGLQDGINAINMAEKVQEAVDAGYSHAHINADGTYSFYTNLWGDEDGGAIDYSDPLNHEVAKSHFHPAEGNDRYYYTEDTPIYTQNRYGSYELYNGAAAPSANNAYRAYGYYTEQGYTTKYIPLSAYALNMAIANGRQSDGRWYIPQGAVFQQVDRFRMEKSENTTGTLEYYDYPVVVDVGDKYDCYAFLGNNGRLTIAPAQGIKLTKTVSGAEAEVTDSFTFDITLSQAVEEPVVTDSEGNALTGWSVEGNVITVTMKAGETVYITGLPTGVTYTVTERSNPNFIGSSENATGTVRTQTVSPVDFVNIPRGYGNLIISKDVDHPYINVPAALTNKEFTINVKLTGEDVANQQFAIAGTDPVQYITTDENGSFSVKLKDNGSLTVVGLPEGTTFTTTETLDPTAHKGFTMDEESSVLSGTIVKNTEVQTHVVNVYEPSSPTATLNVAGTKTLTDPAGTFDWEGKSFTIRLEQYDPDKGTYTTVAERQVTQGALSYSFEDLLSFNAIGTYFYKVSEVIPSERLEGMSYDATVGRFEVQVTDNNVDGELEFVVYDFDTREQIPGTDLKYTYTKNFENIHTTDATYVEFTVDKNVVDPHNTGASEAGYLFELYEVINGEPSTTAAYSMRTVLVNGQGQATFHIPVTKTGTRTFILKENTTADANQIPGMIYDTSEYTVVVSADAEDGKLVPSVTFQKEGQTVDPENVAFENVIDLEPLTLKPYVTKTLNGRDPMADDVFSFHLEQTDGSFVPGSMPNGYKDDLTVDYQTLLAGGTAYYEQIQITQVGTYYFRSVEVAGNAPGMTYDTGIYHVTVDITVQDDKLVKDVSFVKVGVGVPSQEMDSVKFTNTYVNTDTAEVTLSGEKSLDGRDLITGEFKFQLKEGNDVLQTVTNRADGTFVFEPITYTAKDKGTHTYTIVEVDEGKGGVQYDTEPRTVTVTVTDNGKNELVVTKSGDQGIVIENKYTTKDTSVSFSGTKTWYNTDLGQNKTLAGDEFTFVLYASDAAYRTQGDEVARTTNAADGSFGFTLDYAVPGHYYYLLREQIGEEETVNYDAGAYQIHIAVFDNGLGQLIGSVSSISKVGTGASAIAFGNEYTPKPTQLAITGEKELTGHQISEGEFGFQLFASDDSFTVSGEALQTVYNTGDTGVTDDEGVPFGFAPITYDKSGTYYYVVKEVIPEQAVNNVYNGITYDTTAFEVTVTVTDNNGQLTAERAVTVGGTTQELRFVNAYNITNYTDIDIEGTKSLSYNGEPFAFGDRTFEFELLNEQGVRLQTVKADAQGSFKFENIPLTETKEYQFQIREIDTDLGGIVYDGRTYYVSVDAYDDGEGNIATATPVIKLDQQTVSGIVFENKYQLTKTEAQLRVSKVLENKQLTAGMFEFQLLDSENQLLQTKSNLAAGGVRFDPIEYTEPGEHTYTIVEVNGGSVIDGITYDSHQVQVKVTVTDNGDGTMSVDVEYLSTPEFTNTYTVDGDPKFSVSGVKNLSNRDMEDDEFVFVLTDADDNKIETSNIGNTFSFANVKLPGLGTHHFTVTEKNTDLGGMTYDGRSYSVSVTVSDDGKGGMTVGAPVVTLNGVSAQLVFNNTYHAEPTEYTPVAQKNYKDSNGVTKTLLGGEFTFTLTGEGQNQSKQNAAGGIITFDKLTLTEAKTYTYKIKEVDGGKSYITYDDTEYTLSIVVHDDGDGNLYYEDKDITVTPASGSISFDNVYNITGTVAAISGMKELVGGGLNAGDFTFELYETGSTYSIDGLTPVATTTNAANGSFSFSGTTVSALAYNAETVRYYVVKESSANPMDKIRYDETVYQFQVTVTDNTEGQLTADVQCVNADNILFKNVPHDEIVSKTVTYPESSVSINGEKVYAGETLKYTISYKNHTANTLEVDITDTIPAHTSFVSADNNGSFAGGKVTWTDVPVAAGETLTVSFQVKVDENIGAERIPNKATVQEGNNTYETNEVFNYTVVDEVEKKVTYLQSETLIDGNKVYAGETLEYTITYKNTDTKAAKVTITDTIPAHTSFVSADNNGSFADGKVTWTDVPVAAGQTLTVTLTVKVDENLGVAEIENQATVQEGKNIYTTNKVTNHTVVDEVEKDVFYPEADTVSINKNKVYAGETLLYKITYKNTDTKAAKVTITDTIPAHTSFVSADNNGSFAGGKVTWADVPVAAGQTLTVSFQVKVDENIGAERIPNKANVVEGKNTYETNEVFNYTVIDEVEKTVTYPETNVSVNGTKVYAGETLQYTITYKNTDTKESKVTITDTIPAHTTFLSADNNGSFAGGKVTWADVPVAAGQTLTVSFQVKVDENIGAENIPNKATVVEGKNTYETNEVFSYTVIDEVEKTVTYPDSNVSINGKKVYAGETLQYTISYKNTSTQSAKVTVTDTIPAYTSFVSADNGGSFADGVVTWKDIEVQPGQLLYVSFQVKVNEDIGAQRIPNKANVIEGKNTYTTNEVFNYTVVDETEKEVFKADAPSVSVDGKKVSAGDTLIYKISYTNTAAETAKVTITDTIPAHTSFVSADKDGRYADGVVIWELEVPAGQTATVSLQVKVDAENVVIRNKATVEEGKNSYQTNEVITHTVEELEKDVFKADQPTVSIDGQKVAVGDILIYSITYRNTTGKTANVELTDAIPDYTSFIEGSATLGGTLNKGVLTWKLELEAWESVTVTFKVKVNEPSATVTNQATVFDGTNKYQSNTVTNTTPDPIPQTGDPINTDLLVSTMGFSVLGIIIMLAVLVLDRKKGRFER